MHYRVESAALPRVKTFRNRDKAVAFATKLAKGTSHEVRVVLVSRSSAYREVFYIFNRRQAPSDGS
jgi:hypothetical protein